MNKMALAMNDVAKQRIDEIKNDLIHSLEPFINSSMSTSNNFSQENIIDINNMEREQRFELLNNNNNSSIYSNSSDMSGDDVYTEPEQISSNVNITANNEQHFNNSKL